SHIDRWLREGMPMPTEQRRVRDSSAADGVVRYDYGNTLCRISTPWVEAPNAHYFARSPGNPLASCYRTLTADEMKAAYGDRQCYIDTFRGKVDALVAAGWALPSEAALFDPD